MSEREIIAWTLVFVLAVTALRFWGLTRDFMRIARDASGRTSEAITIAQRAVALLTPLDPPNCPTCGSDDPAYRYGTPCFDEWHGAHLINSEEIR